MLFSIAMRSVSYMNLAAGFLYSILIVQFYGLETFGKVIFFIISLDIVLGLSSSRPNLRISSKAAEISYSQIATFLCIEYFLVLLGSGVFYFIWALSLIELSQFEVTIIIFLNFLRPIQSISLGVIQSKSSVISTLLINSESVLKLTITLIYICVYSNIIVGNEHQESLVLIIVIAKLFFIISHLVALIFTLNIGVNEEGFVKLLRINISDFTHLYLNNIMKTVSSYADRLLLGYAMSAADFGVFHLIKSFSTGIISFYAVDRQLIIKSMSNRPTVAKLKQEIINYNKNNLKTVLLLSFSISAISFAYFILKLHYEKPVDLIISIALMSVYAVIVARLFWIVPVLNFYSLSGLSKFNVCMSLSTVILSLFGAISGSIVLFCLSQVIFACILNYYAWRLFDEVTKTT